MVKERIVFIGCGSMAEAIISGILKAKLVNKNQIYVTNKQDEERLAFIRETYGVETSYDREGLIKLADVVVLAMKPRDVKASLLKINPFLKENQLVLSVLAGTMTETIESMIDKDIAVIRAMPNTSAHIGYSATAIAAGSYAGEKEITFAERLFQTIGLVKVVHEEDMHTVTAISGSGPAYIYYLAEAMLKAAEDAGINHETAQALITQTIIGAGKMLEQSGEEPAKLRENITSQGGTTEAGLETLAKEDFERIIIACINSARNRSIDLSKAD